MEINTKKSSVLKNKELNNSGVLTKKYILNNKSVNSKSINYKKQKKSYHAELENISESTKLNVEKKTSHFFLLRYHFELMWRVILITVSIMGILGGMGYVLDKTFGKFPLFMTSGLLLSYPLVQIIVYKVFKKLSKNKSWKVHK